METMKGWGREKEMKMGEISKGRKRNGVEGEGEGWMEN